jgi:hypothetical protein
MLGIDRFFVGFIGFKSVKLGRDFFSNSELLSSVPNIACGLFFTG